MTLVTTVWVGALVGAGVGTELPTVIATRPPAGSTIVAEQAVPRTPSVTMAPASARRLRTADLMFMVPQLWAPV